MALASSEAWRVGLPVSSIVTSAIIASKTPPGELMMIWSCVYETVRRSARDENNVAGTKFQQLAVETKVVVSFANDKGLIVCRMPVVARTRFRGLYCFANGIRIPVFASGRLEGKAHSLNLEFL